MKTCTKCGATFDEGDVASDSDREALPADDPAMDAGDGDCLVCARTGAPGTRTMRTSSIPPRTRVGHWSILGARSADDFDARDDSGMHAVLAIGTDDALAGEVLALEAMKGDSALPRLIDRGQDPRWGAYLALSPIPLGARKLAEVAPTMTIDDALSTLRMGLDLADRVERAGYEWSPLSDDVYVDANGAVSFARLRGVHILVPRERLDARAITEAIGSTFLPHPVVRGSSRLVRFFSPRALLDGDRLFSVESERAELVSIAEEGAPLASTSRVAFVCDPGMKRPHNEDAVAAASGEVNGERGAEPWAVLVVCDGVSSSTHADKASAIAAKTACDMLEHFAKSSAMSPEAFPHALSAAVRAAHAAICAQRFELAGAEPPGTTIVCALVFRRKLTVAWVGDSRAYFIVPGGGGELLTHDHSWINETVARGEMTRDEASRQPLAHALTRCLGPLEVCEGFESVEPDVRTRELPAAGLVVLCSDGLWNYFPNAQDIARLLHAGDTNAALVARLLVNHALERGGHDNVTVAVYAHESHE